VNIFQTIVVLLEDLEVRGSRVFDAKLVTKLLQENSSVVVGKSRS